MPDFWSHNIVGDVISKKDFMNEHPTLIFIKNHMHLFRFGCQGPDFLFYANSRNYYLKGNLGHLGGQVHDHHIIDQFKYLLLSAKKTDDLFLITYLAGYITHYCADITCHPQIDYLTKNTKLSHKSIELNFDLFLIETLFRTTLESLSPEKSIFCHRKELLAFGKTYSTLLNTYYNKHISYDQMIGFNKDFIYGEKFVMSRKAKKIPKVKKIEALTKISLSDYAYPDVIDLQELTLRDYQTFKDNIKTSIKLSELCLKDYIKVLDGTLSIEAFLEKYITKNYMGVLLDGHLSKN